MILSDYFSPGQVADTAITDKVAIVKCTYAEVYRCPGEHQITTYGAGTKLGRVVGIVQGSTKQQTVEFFHHDGSSSLKSQRWLLVKLAGCRRSSCGWVKENSVYLMDKNSAILGTKSSWWLLAILGYKVLKGR